MRHATCYTLPPMLRFTIPLSPCSYLSFFSFVKLPLAALPDSPSHGRFLFVLIYACCYRLLSAWVVYKTRDLFLLFSLFDLHLAWAAIDGILRSIPRRILWDTNSHILTGFTRSHLHCSVHEKSTIGHRVPYQCFFFLTSLRLATCLCFLQILDHGGSIEINDSITTSWRHHPTPPPNDSRLHTNALARNQPCRTYRHQIGR